MCNGIKSVLLDGHIPMHRGFVMTKAFLLNGVAESVIWLSFSQLLSIWEILHTTTGESR